MTPTIVHAAADCGALARTGTQTWELLAVTAVLFAVGGACLAFVRRRNGRGGVVLSAVGLLLVAGALVSTPHASAWAVTNPCPTSAGTGGAATSSASATASPTASASASPTSSPTATATATATATQTETPTPPPPSTTPPPTVDDGGGGGNNGGGGGSGGNS